MHKIKLTPKNIFLTLVIVVILAYWGSWNGFFQQDEWAGLGGFFALQGLELPELLKEMYRPMFEQGLGHFLPWTPVANYIRYAIFRLNYPPYAILGLVLHAVATILVFLLGRKLTKSRTAGFFVALFFAVAASASQGVTWVGTSLPTQLAAIFSLVSIIFWLDWLENNNKQKLWLSFGALIAAIGFKETAAFLFLFLPAVGFVYKPQLRSKLLAIFGLIVGGYVLVRAGTLLASLGFSSAIEETAALLVSAASNFIKLPLKGIGQTIFPQEAVLLLADKVVQFLKPSGMPIKGNPAYDVYLEGQVVLPALYVLGIASLATLALFSKRQEKEKKKASLSYLLLLVLSFLPLAFIPTRELSATFIPPRGLYIPLVGVAAFWGLGVRRFFREKAILAILLLILGGVHILVLRSQIDNLTKVGRQRKQLLWEIKAHYPDLPEKVVFYIESDKAYYGLPPEEKTVPFQSGFGQTLLVWYHQEEVFPREFFQERFLWEITDQDYKQVETRSFGYFRKLDLLKQAIEEYNIPSNAVIAFTWKSETNVLVDITDGVREELKVSIK